MNDKMPNPLKQKMIIFPQLANIRMLSWQRWKNWKRIKNGHLQITALLLKARL